MNANLGRTAAGSRRRYPVVCYRELPIHASAEFDLPADPDEEYFMMMTTMKRKTTTRTGFSSGWKPSGGETRRALPSAPLDHVEPESARAFAATGDLAAADPQ